MMDSRAGSPFTKSSGEPKYRGQISMTPEQWEQFQAFTRSFGEQSESGVDISLLRANLKLMPTERIEKMRRALATYLEVRHARNAT